MPDAPDACADTRTEVTLAADERTEVTLAADERTEVTLAADERTEVTLATLRSLKHALASPVGALEMNTRGLSKHLGTLGQSPAERERLALCLELQQDVLTSVAHLRQLLDLLGERLEAVPLDVGPCDVAATARTFARPENGISAVTVDAPEPASAAIGAQALSMAVSALLENAQQCTPPGPITLRVRNTDTGPQLRVEDTGPGMPADMLREAAKPLRSTRPTQLGMGLTIAEELVRRAGGRLLLERLPGGGTAAVLCLPAP